MTDRRELEFRQADTNARLRTVLDRLSEIAEEAMWAPEDVSEREAAEAEVIAGALEAGLAKLEASLAARRRVVSRARWAEMLAAVGA